MKNRSLVFGGRAFGRRGLSVCAVLIALLSAAPSFAATITVNTSGGPQTNQCNLTDAVEAAVTNAAVHSCSAGSSGNTDTIQLQANTVYQSYGQVIHVPSTGGALVIQGNVTNGEVTTTIRAPDYGFPSPNPLVNTTSVCQFPAAIFSGGSNLTLKDLDLEAGASGMTGVCQYAGSFALNNVFVGDSEGNHAFDYSGILSNPNSDIQDTHRILTLTDSYFWYNYNSGILARGYTDITMTGGGFEGNGSDGGGAMAWEGPSNNTASVTFSGVDFSGNSARVAGGLYLSFGEPNSQVRISGSTFIYNNADTGPGAIFVGASTGTDQVLISDATRILYNTAGWDSQQNSLNTDWYVPQMVNCSSNSSIENMNGDEWDTPPLRGDGTCVYP